MKGIRSHIVLIGFMGSGKTTIGRLLSKSLNMEFIDLDFYIENKVGSSIKEIFEKEGEAYFRKIESKSLFEILSMSQKVILSTGGGAPCFLDNMELIKKTSLSIYLKVGRDRLTNRLKEDTQRPLIQNKTKNELLAFVKKSLKIRDRFYSQADIRVRAIDSPTKLTERITKYILKKDL